MSQEKKVFKTEWAGRSLTIETGQLAKQANGAVLVRYGDTVVLSTAVASKEPRDGDFFPLTVNYEEKMYAAGKIPGGFKKREGRPGDEATLTARLIDRPIRPLFPKGYRHDVQIMNTVLSADPDCSPEMAAMIGSSMALSVSDIPFQGPIAGVNVGYIDGKYVINPTLEQKEVSRLDLEVAGHKDAVNMVEAGASEITEQEMLEAIFFGHEEIKRLVAFQEEVVEHIQPVKKEFIPVERDEELVQRVKSLTEEKGLKETVLTFDKQQRDENLDALKAEIATEFVDEADPENELLIDEVYAILNDLVKEEVRRLIADEKIRPDGRKPDEIRPLESEVGLLPRAHGSGLFTRGQTQALSVLTLGALGDYQLIDGLGPEIEKRFMHHYNFPNFSVGETGPVRAPGRREIGHGALGERALRYIIPDTTEFPYTIRIVSEVLESNGSSSQASICGSTLALMDAGVPIKAPVAGIAMGLVTREDSYTILTDIQGMEDALGDMDFKVAGTKEGITAIQMDIKIDGLTREVIEEALEQARQGRLAIMDHMLQTIDQPRSELSAYAPKVEIMHIKPEKIRDVIGPGGKKINEIIDETGVKLDIEQDGTIFIGAVDQEMINRAREIINEITREAEVGQVYHAKVKRIEKYGAFVELFPGKDALLHISQISKDRINKVEDVLKIGDTIEVKITEIDKQGRVNASHKVLDE
ncbi:MULTISPECIES: polyribonucleotide nucleotidyltransferase [Staphylococcus]|jgi:polyribonucleotide nucleotidyltransferase|uniref:polyribonucleotide nucleotidyltransferase n=1 Tax=Staphylococcus TaxID=1279 RepID=UPI0003646FB4|nr:MULTISPECIES: polyribonucleotide nucleotidyltransferase [Staphylococcus]OFK82677.1 polyribonucleotide nucleotidyltransferase [Staphylococcus sp. HMSC057A02]OFM60031.1 polyribonucleotide nucleotidyltransferase [Staphylococcus sp. HMSC059G05]OFM64967.1 polyribonucleotide nucleotidyltransferase [Staphylococcus sp. HMSC068D07]OFN13261.1 polyribonucleotide nucleotidyltransferase [Staphylococcus sp. HMSC058D09]OFR10307.1 polyribonucleotide nucleotidyltransferase [Staphylococcus sp. HMSC078E07]OF